MRVKVKDQWYEATDECPIMVELTDQDKTNITNMIPTATRYAIFQKVTPDGEPSEWADLDRMGAWMDEGAWPDAVPVGEEWIR
ncbi:MAG: hypothetical protein OXE50_14250 [Chloroflexi bacterium]|nr:hypothetical protein [Chloroflexota bacterium]